MLMGLLKSSGLDIDALHRQAETMASAAVTIRDTQHLIVKQQEIMSTALLNILSRLDALEKRGHAEEVPTVDETPVEAENPLVDEHASAVGTD
jgi:hypothetical protein